MPSKIEDYAIIGDTKTVALVDLTGSIDWWCAPRIDSGAPFAALLGDAGNGRWLIAPKGEVRKVTRRYEPETLILETIFETSTGSVSVCDFMPPNDGHSMIHRIVESRGGTVEMQMELIVRYEYGAITPWATATGDGLVLVAARDGLRLHSPVPLVGKDNTTVASFSVAGETRRSFSLTWFPSVIHAPLPFDSLAARNHTRHYWHDWVGRCTYKGGSRDLVRALSHHPEGPHLRPHRRRLRRGDDLAPRDPRGQPELGLPLFLAPGLDLYPECPLGLRVHRRGGGVGGLAPPRRGGGPRGDTDHVRRRRGTAPGGVRAGSSQRLRGLGARPYRQQRSDPTPARRLRRGPGLCRHLLAEPHPPAVQMVAGSADGDPQAPGDDLARARQWDLGGPRPAAALHPLEGHGLGGFRPCHHAVGRGCLAKGTEGPLAAGARRSPCGSLRKGFRP